MVVPGGSSTQCNLQLLRVLEKEHSRDTGASDKYRIVYRGRLQVCLFCILVRRVTVLRSVRMPEMDST